MFKDKFPASAAAILFLANVLKDGVAAMAPGESLLAKITGFGNLAPALVTLLPQIGGLGAEVKSFTAGDDVAAAELLVTDLAFSSEKAQAVVAALFPVLEDLAALEPKIVALVDAIKS